MGKKYIIEIEDKPFHKGNGDFLYRVKGFNSLVFDMTGIGMLTPYTDPDFEQVRKEAYDKGYDDATAEIGSDEQAIAEKAYQKGLSDAWEAARKIADMPYGEEEKAFGSGGWAFIVKHTAPEAIEKIRQYEQVKNELDQEEENIQIGDEVISPNGKGVVTEITDIYMRIMYEKGSGQVIKLEELTKTGRHFPEIAEVLQKMKESDNG